MGFIIKWNELFKGGRGLTPPTLWRAARATEGRAGGLAEAPRVAPPVAGGGGPHGQWSLR